MKPYGLNRHRMYYGWNGFMPKNWMKILFGNKLFKHRARQDGKKEIENQLDEMNYNISEKPFVPWNSED